MTPFGEYLRTCREAAGLSVRDLAGDLGLSHAYVAQVERGDRPPMVPAHWPKLVEAVPGIDARELERRARQGRPIELDLADASAEVVDMAAALADRINAGAVDDETANRIRAILEEE